MKKTVALTICICCFAMITSAQISTPISTTKTKVTTTKTDSTKPQTLLPVNTPVPKLPDIRITSVSFSMVNTSVQPSGATTYTFAVNYTIKNEGNAAVDAYEISMQGLYDYTNTFTRPDPGCGGGFGGLKGQIIQPGGSASGSYRCTLTFDKNHPPYYRLVSDYSRRVTESNEDNNTVTTTIVF